MGAILLSLGAVVMRLAVWPGHPDLAAAAPLCTLAAVASLVVLTGPAWLASERVTRTLRPSL